MTASRTDPIGRATTASQGHVTAKELELRPAYRVGQLLESVPGLVATVHSGEGKANQYLMRGFSLDHGTDLATFVDDMPVNEPTHAHGQGYTDLNFLIPELGNGIDYTKGPFYADIGDFGVVGSDHIQLRNTLTNQVTVSAGTLGDYSVFAGGTFKLRNGDPVLAAVTVEHLDGPWDHSDNYRALKGALRWSHQGESNSVSITAMGYRGQWNATSDQPVAAYDEGLIGRYGTLDPSDGGYSERESLSVHDALDLGRWTWSSSAYVVHSRLTLWNDFTHFLTDSVNGDQAQQDETRTTVGGTSSLGRHDTLWGIGTETTLGVQGRWDDLYVDRRHTDHRTVLLDCPDSLGATGAYVCNADRVQQGNVGLYGQETTRWLPWLRTVIGLRGDNYAGHDRSLVNGAGGSVSQWLFQPKGSLIVGPWKKTELYLSIGQGYHSNDIRAVTGTVPSDGIADGRIATPFMSKATSEEIGIRTDIVPKLNLQASLFRIDFGSELTYDQDEGVNEAGAPSRREGVELSGQYRPLRWLEVNSDIAFARARYFTGDPVAYGLPGRFIPNAPNFVGSVGILVDHLGRWFGGAQLSWLGPYPLVEDNSLRSNGYKEVDVDVGYHITPKLTATVSIFNLFNSHADAIDYAYEYRVTPGAPAGAGATFHPLEPLSARFSVTANF